MTQNETKSQEKERYRKCLEREAHCYLMEELTNRLRGYSNADLAEILVKYHEDDEDGLDNLHTVLVNVILRSQESGKIGRRKVRLRWPDEDGN